MGVGGVGVGSTLTHPAEAYSHSDGIPSIKMVALPTGEGGGGGGGREFVWLDMMCTEEWRG